MQTRAAESRIEAAWDGQHENPVLIVTKGALRSKVKVYRLLRRGPANVAPVANRFVWGFVATVVLGCAPAAVSAPNMLRPIDERRASEVIARTFSGAHFEPDTNRTVTLFGGKSVQLEVAAAHHKFGIAFLTREQQAALGDSLPKRAADSDALLVVPGDEQGVRVLMLFERDYLQGDLAGETHASTNIAAEMKLERDVRDFLRKASEDEWP